MPFWAFRIDSPLPAAEVEQRIVRLLRTARKQTFWESLQRSIDPPRDEPPFDGTLLGRTFKMTRVIHYRNSFLPVIRGTISDTSNGGTTVHVRMTLGLFTIVFLLFWLGFVGMGVPWSFLGDLHFNIHDSTFVPLGMMLFGLLLPVVAFYPEARKAERLIRNAIERGSQVV